jgi:hypothetical protein
VPNHNTQSALIYFNIKDRYSGKVMFTAFIAVDDDTPIGVKIGLAVKWALDAKKSLAWADLTGANLAGFNLTGVNLVGANLDGANLDGVNLAGANLTGVNLAGASLIKANLTRACLTRANLTGANLTGANLDGVGFTEANLIGADLIGANLIGTNFTGARLTGARLNGVYLTGARLTGANLDGANVRGELVTRVIARLNREIDPYSFVAFALLAGGVKVLAGCHWFTVAEYRAHIAANYPNTDKATETARILDYIEARAADLGIALEPPARKVDSADTLLKLQSAEARARELEARVEVLEKVLRPYGTQIADAMFSQQGERS